MSVPVGGISVTGGGRHVQRGQKFLVPVHALRLPNDWELIS